MNTALSRPDVLISEVGPRDELAPGVRVEAGIATAFGCAIQGEVPEGDVVGMAGEAVAAGVDEAGLSDTTGMANPAQVRRLFKKVRAAIGERARGLPKGWVPPR